MVQRGTGVLWGLFHKGSHLWSSTLMTESLPMDIPPTTITLGTGFQHVVLGRHRHSVYSIILILCHGKGINWKWGQCFVWSLTRDCKICREHLPWRYRTISKCKQHGVILGLLVVSWDSYASAVKLIVHWNTTSGSGTSPWKHEYFQVVLSQHSFISSPVVTEHLL